MLLRSLPTISSEEYSVSLSNAGFTRVMMPAESVKKMASLHCAMACCRFWKASAIFEGQGLLTNAGARTEDILARSTCISAAYESAFNVSDTKETATGCACVNLG